jgi:outer membrane protein TolC
LATRNAPARAGWLAAILAASLLCPFRCLATPGGAPGAPRAGMAAAAADAGGASAGAAAAADSLTVAQCVALARAVAPEVRAQASAAEAAALDSLAAARNGWPAFSLFGGALVVPRDHYDPVITNLGEYSLKLGLDRPLLDGGARRRERAQAALAAAAAVAQLERSTRDAGLRAAEVALAALRQRDLEASDRDAFAWLDRLGALIQGGVRSGTRAQADAVRVRIERDAVEAELLSGQQVRGALGRELAELTGRAVQGPFELREPDPATDAPPAAADSLALFARIERSPEVRAARVAEAGERLALDQTRRRSALLVDLAADAGLAGADLTRAVPEDLALAHPGATFADRLRRDLGASVAVQFHRPLLDPAAAPARGAREAAVESARQRTTTVVAQRRRELDDLLGRWRAAGARLELAQAARDRAEEQLLRMHSLYAGGATSLLELLDARRQVDEARARLADARFELRVAQWEGELQR